MAMIADMSEYDIYSISGLDPDSIRASSDFVL